MYADKQRPNKPLTIHGATKPAGLVSNLTLNTKCYMKYIQRGSKEILHG